jgi:polyisoprenoid-binding protein YceI
LVRYRIIPERSHVWIDARSNVHPIHSSTDGLEGYVDVELKDGHVDLSENEPTGKLSLPVSRLSSGNGMEDREMQKRIDARRFPVIEGVLSTMEETAEGDGTYRVRGEVSFRGVVRPHEDKMSISPVDESTLRLAGESTFDIRDFGMEPPRILILKVLPEVQVRVEIVAVKEA